jgi:hypothetical protein
MKFSISLNTNYYPVDQPHDIDKLLAEAALAGHVTPMSPGSMADFAALAAAEKVAEEKDAHRRSSSRIRGGGSDSVIPHEAPTGAALRVTLKRQHVQAGAPQEDAKADAKRAREEAKRDAHLAARDAHLAALAKRLALQAKVRGGRGGCRVLPSYHAEHALRCFRARLAEDLARSSS